MSILDAIADDQADGGRTRREAPRAPHVRRPVGDTRAARYSSAALEGECDDVRNAQPGERNNRLNVAALRLGGLVASGHLSEADARNELYEAGLSAGLGEHETRATIASGMAAGMKQPREIPERSHVAMGRSGPLRVAPSDGESEGATPEQPLEALARHAAQGLSRAPHEIVWRGARDVFAPLPPTKWVVPGLHLGPGRPAMLAAYGASGKTLLSQSLALAVATGVPVWDEFSPVRGKVAHIDHEQGWHATARRYQRLALGMGLEPGELDGQLLVASLPQVYLTDANAYDQYCRACDGVSLVILDAFRGAIPGLDENDSSVRICLDALTKVSQTTGAAFWVLHHAGKPKEGHADARTVARGSSAIFDACGLVLNLTGAKGAPKLVSEQKVPAEAEGAAVEDFRLEIEDVLVGTNPTGGVRVAYRPITGALAAEGSGPSPQIAARAESIVSIVRRRPGCSRNFIRVEARGNSAQTDQALAWLVDSGRLRREPAARGAHSYFEGSE